MSLVQIRYTDVLWQGKQVRLIRFPNAPSRPSAFVSEGAAIEADPNAHLPEEIHQEVAELFKSEPIQLYFDSAEMVFWPAKDLRSFTADFIENESLEYTWHEATLKSTYQ